MVKLTLMKRYKLIKEYPGSPKLNTIYWEQVGYGCITYKEPDGKESIYTNSVNIKMIENHPEYWQEIVEKDYEILSFGFKDGFDRVLNEKGFYLRIDSENNTLSLDKMLTLITIPNQYFIKSVKRLSDGEIFTIGDIIGNKYCKIYDFIINVDGLLLTGVTGNETRKSLNILKKIKQPLFTSEDGVDIFEGDSYVICRRGAVSNNLCIFTYNAITSNHAIWKNRDEDSKIFSSRKKAEEYIDFNKIQYSKQDVFNIIHKGFDKKSLYAQGKHKVLAMFDIGPLPSEKQKLFTIEEIEVKLENYFKEWNSTTLIDKQVLINLLKQ